MTTDTSTTSPWFWPKEWVREEKFWRDIGTRVLAGVITATIIYLGALLLGYLNTPEIGAGVLLVLGLGASAILVAIAATLLVRVPSRMRSSRPVVARIVVAVALVAAAIGLAVGVVSDVLRA